MRKVSIVMMTAFCVGASGLVGAADLNPQPLPPGVKSTGGDGGTQMRKAGGEQQNLTQHDQSQISGNLNGDGKTNLNGDGKVLDYKPAGFDKTKRTNKNSSFMKYKNAKKGNGFIKGEKGFVKSEKGNSKIEATGGSGAGKAGLNFTHGNDLQKANGLNKAGMGDGSALPAVHN
jgi:hypothetical protein